METTYFYHLDSRNLPSCYSAACIKPAKYYFNRIEDLQCKCDTLILLSVKRFSSNEDCSLEVVLTNDEINSLRNANESKDIFLYQSVIPISRVKKVYFKSDDTLDKIVTLINMSSGFLPMNFATVLTDNITADYSNISLPEKNSTSLLTEKIRRFDSILGGFALMRLSGEEGMNYPQNYFSTLAKFNSVIETELSNSNKKISDIYWDAFEGKDKFNLLFPYLNKTITEDDLNELSDKQNQRIQKNRISGIIDIELLDKETYIVAVLNLYGLDKEGRKNKIDGLILDGFKKGIKQDKSEVISLCYGINRGYTVFSNKYKNAGIEKIVKFELNSQVDYYTIEAVFQYAFNGIEKSSEFPYLDIWCPKFPRLKRKLKQSEYLILDKVIIGDVVKVGSSKWWSLFMQSFFQKNNEDLFKPFMHKIYDKIKTDIDQDYNDIIDEKNDEIASLKSSNTQSKQQSAIIEEQKNQIEDLKRQLESVKDKKSIVNEKEPPYSKSLNVDASSETDSKTIEECKVLISELSKLTSGKKAQAIISKFYTRHPEFDKNLFNEK